MRKLNVSFYTITGMMLGIEFPPKGSIATDDDDAENIDFVLVLDILIFRIVLFTEKV